MRYAIRSLSHAPSFTAVAVATIAVGIAAVTSVFSIVDAVLLKPLPFRDASGLFVLASANPHRGITDSPFSYPAFVEMASTARAFSGLSAFANERLIATGHGDAEQLAAARVSASFFDVIGVPVVAGRPFLAEEDRPGGPPVVILGHRYWLRRFGGAGSAIGQTLTLDGSPSTIVGALGSELPPPFADIDLWTIRPGNLSGFTPEQIAGGLGYLTGVARLAPGITEGQAQADATAAVHNYARANPANADADPDATMRLIPIRERGVAATRPPLLLLAFAVALVLLVSCANVANLLLVRAEARSHEGAVRTALGATGWDLARWLCAESLALAAIGGVAGVSAAYVIVRIASAALAGLPRGSEVAVDAPVLAFAAAIAGVSGLAVALVPIRRLITQSTAHALRAGRGATRHRRGLTSALVVAEVAVSIVLLVAAAVLLQGFTRMLNAPVGFQPDRLVTMRLSLPTTRYGDPVALNGFVNRLVPSLEAIPGVASAAAAMVVPPNPTVMAPYMSADGPQVEMGRRPVGIWSAVTLRYFHTMGMPIVKGRDLAETDTESAPLVVVVSDDLARRLWPADNPIGKRLLVGRQTGFAEVVG